MENENTLAFLAEINIKLAQQISSLIDVCEKQQMIIDSLEKRVEKLENATTPTDSAALEEYNRYKEFYEKNTSDWGDQYL